MISHTNSPKVTGRTLPVISVLQIIADGKSEDSVYGIDRWLNSHLILPKKINSQM